MNFLSKVRHRLRLLYNRHIQHAPFLLEVDRWFRDRGDETLRLDYPLMGESVVFDVGGYLGDFAEAVYQRYGCKVYIFEPVPEFYEKCIARFSGNEKIVTLNYGLSSIDESLDIGLAADASSFASPHATGAVQKVLLRSVARVIGELGLSRIDLMKINIEGGEFEVIPALVKSGDIKKIQYLQVQFHNFVTHAESRRAEIRTQLQKTHMQMWNYDFVWESWKITGGAVE